MTTLNNFCLEKLSLLELFLFKNFPSKKSTLENSLKVLRLENPLLDFFQIFQGKNGK